MHLHTLILRWIGARNPGWIVRRRLVFYPYRIPSRQLDLETMDGLTQKEMAKIGVTPTSGGVIPRNILLVSFLIPASFS